MTQPSPKTVQFVEDAVIYVVYIGIFVWFLHAPVWAAVGLAILFAIVEAISRVD